MALTGLHPTDYETALKAWIISKEGSKTSVLKVHTDGVGVPTIGAGYALTSHSGTWATDFTTAEITITEAQQTVINGNTITEASKYTTDEDTHELVVDVQLETDTKDTKVEPDDIPDFEVDEATLTLPQLKGSGQVYDSFIAYNVDPEFKAIALAYANDLSKLQKNPDALIENYSGYTQLISQLRERYSAPEFSMSESDKKAWIADRFFGTDTFMSDIEKHYTTNLNNANHTKYH